MVRVLACSPAAASSRIPCSSFICFAENSFPFSSVLSPVGLKMTGYDHAEVTKSCGNSPSTSSAEA